MWNKSIQPESCHPNSSSSSPSPYHSLLLVQKNCLLLSSASPLPPPLSPSSSSPSSPPTHFAYHLTLFTWSSINKRDWKLSWRVTLEEEWCIYGQWQVPSSSHSYVKQFGISSLWQLLTDWGEDVPLAQCLQMFSSSKRLRCAYTKWIMCKSVLSFKCMH